ncbi:MAG: HAD-IG family 5'-nucleotidase [Thermoanaerobaculia bacterium]|nr:HAD-IG family 5'-nucleotidase [Thermoanaerobaculia bacterium]
MSATAVVPGAPRPTWLAPLLPALRHALLRRAFDGGKPPLPRRVFVNRNLRLERIRYVGFDLDWTLAEYDREAIDTAIFELALGFLVEQSGYPAAIRADAEFRPAFPRRGLIVDRQLGTVLKMSRHRYVGRAYLGRTPLTQEERFRLYRLEPLDLGSDRFYRVDTLFELPEVNLFSELVELGRRDPSRIANRSPQALFDDVRHAVDSIHANGSLKARITADLPRYLPRDPELALALVRLALGGRRLFLITNSDFAYTERLCSYLLDGALPGLGSWRDLFDLVVASAGKPSFFRRERPFVPLSADGSEGPEVAVPSWGGVYRGGSRDGLMALLEVPGEQILYVGDHIYSDVLTSKLRTTWRTALIVRELEDELEIAAEVAPELRHLSALREELSDLGHRMDDLRDVVALACESGENGEMLGAAGARLAELEAQHAVLRQRAAELQRRTSERHHRIWGPLFRQGSNQSLFGAQVKDFACIYTSRVGNLARYGTNHYFRVLEDPMTHDLAG